MDLKTITYSVKKIWKQAAFFSFFANVLALIIPLYMIEVFDRVLASGSQATLFYLTLITIGVIGVIGFFHFFLQTIFHSLGMWLDKKLLNETCIRAPDAIINGDLRSLDVVDHVAQVRDYLLSKSAIDLFDLPWTPIYLLVLCIINGWLGWFAILGAIIVVSIALTHNAHIKPLLKKLFIAQKKERSEINNTLKHAEISKRPTNPLIDNVRHVVVPN